MVLSEELLNNKVYI